MRITLTNHHSDSCHKQLMVNVLSGRYLLDEASFIEKSELTTLDFHHPLFNETVIAASDDDDTYYLEYDDFEQLVLITRRIYATLLHRAPLSTACRFVIKPSPQFVKTRKDYRVAFSMTHRQRATWYLTIPQLETVVSYVKGTRFEYYDHLVFDQTIAFNDLPSLCNADDLYHANEDAMAFCKRTDRTHDLELRYINATIGFGVYARAAIPKDDMIVFYSGDKVSKQRREDQYGFNCAADLLNHDIDASKKGNMARFVNHSPNQHALQDKQWHCSNAVPLCYQLHGMGVIIYITTRTILPGEQVLISYGDNYFKENDEMVLWHRNESMSTVKGKKIPSDSYAKKRQLRRVLKTLGVREVQNWNRHTRLASITLGSTLVYLVCNFFYAI